MEIITRYKVIFDKNALEIMGNYLSRFSQGSVLRPILFNIFLNGLFFVLKETDVCNFADDT